VVTEKGRAIRKRLATRTTGDTNDDGAEDTKIKKDGGIKGRGPARKVELTCGNAFSLLRCQNCTTQWFYNVDAVVVSQCR
jgi:hypothetical protein